MRTITTAFLNEENSIMLQSKTVGSLLEDKKISQLYSDRESSVDTIVIHFMSNCITKPHSPYELTDLLQIFITYEVSAHYLITREGEIVHLVPNNKKAWHAGGSIMPSPDNRTGVNDFSIGIELAGQVDKSFTDEQYKSLSQLVLKLIEKEEITSIVGHEDISGTRAVSIGLRKEIKPDPGPHFDWERLQSLCSSISADTFKHGN